MKKRTIDINNELTTFLMVDCDWECPEADDENADAETLIHPDLPGVCIKLNDIDGEGGLEKLLIEIYEQACEYTLKQTQKAG